MTIGIDKALGIHPQALLLRAARAQTLASNIANADTPGYKAQDIDFGAVLAKATQGSVHTTALDRSHPSHLTGVRSTSTADLQYRLPLMPSLDGNSVDLQVEQAQFAENTTQFLASLRFLNGKLRGMMTAIKGE